MNLTELAEKIIEATKEGLAAAEAVGDGGTCNLDHVVITGLKHVRRAALENALGCRHLSRAYAGAFRLPAPFPGQANQRYVGVQAQAAGLRARGVECYVSYHID